MLANTPSLDLVEFIETQILPQYASFDRAHNMEHVTRVIRRSMELVKTLIWPTPLQLIMTWGCVGIGQTTIYVVEKS